MGDHAAIPNDLAIQCSCGDWAMLKSNYRGADALAEHVHHAEKATLRAEVASLRQQLDEANRVLVLAAEERDNLWRRFNSSQDSNKTLAAMAREELDLRKAAEADNARLLDVYRAAEVYRATWNRSDAPAAFFAALDAYRAGTPAEAPDGERA